MSDTQTRQQQPRTRAPEQADNPFADGQSQPQQQQLATAYGDVARACRRDCERGQDAVRALHARRNNSGQ